MAVAVFDEFAVGRACEVFDLRRGSFRVWASRRWIASRLPLALVCDVGSAVWLVSNRSGCFGFQRVNHFITSALAPSPRNNRQESQRAITRFRMTALWMFDYVLCWATSSCGARKRLNDADNDQYLEPKALPDRCPGARRERIAAATAEIVAVCA